MIVCEQPYCALPLEHAGPCNSAPVRLTTHQHYRDALHAAQRCGIREGETLAELILRLYSETLSDD